MAITWLLKAMDIGKADSEILIFLAQAYEQQGETGTANKWYQKIIDDFPGTEYADMAKDYMDANGGVIEDEPEDGQTDDQDEGEESEGTEGQEVQTGESVE